MSRLTFIMQKNQLKERSEKMLRRNRVLLIFVPAIFVMLHCSQPALQVTELNHYPLDDLTGIITQEGVEIDKQISSDGNGSLKITAPESTVVRLFEIGDVDIENGRLTYQAKLKTEDVEGKVYLEMWCRFPGKGEYFSRGLQSPLTGTTDWSSEEIPFFLKKGENPDNIKLNLIITGKGTVWLDDIRLIKGPLK